MIIFPTDNKCHMSTLLGSVDITVLNVCEDSSKLNNNTDPGFILNCTSDLPSYSKCIESFLDLPPVLALTPTYHVRENPHTVKITNYFNPIGQKRNIKEGKEEKRKEKQADTINFNPPPKRNKQTSL